MMQRILLCKSYSVVRQFNVLPVLQGQNDHLCRMRIGSVIAGTPKIFYYSSSDYMNTFLNLSADMAALLLVGSNTSAYWKSATKSAMQANDISSWETGTRLQVLGHSSLGKFLYSTSLGYTYTPLSKNCSPQEKEEDYLALW